MEVNIFHGPALIYYLVKKMKEKYPSSQIGKTVVQKLVYLLSRHGVGNFDYSLYHYGPYSSQVSSEITFAEEIGVLDIKWIPDKGYLISGKPTSSFRNLLSYLDKKEIAKINKIIQKYGRYNATDLSIIATALFLKENFDVNDISNLTLAVASLKPQFDKNKISNLIEETL